MKRRNQNQKFSFPFFAGSPHTPRRNRNCKEIFGFGIATEGSVRGASVIRQNPADFARNTFELRPIHTANVVEIEKVISILKNGGVGVLPTDTLYGLVGSALQPETVERIIELKNRPEDKKFIILIGREKDLELFGVHLTDFQQEAIKKYWPGPVSLILSTKDGNLAFRLPAKEDLRELLQQTGPLIAPSANPSGASPATSIEEAKKYFGDKVDFYIDAGELTGQPSKLIDLTGEGEVIIRP